MALPQRVYDDEENEGKRLSALERAQKRWGMTPDSEPSDLEQAEEAAGEDKTALDKARERWGEAGVHDGDGKTTDKKETAQQDEDDDEGDDDADFSYNPEEKGKQKGWRGRILNRKSAVGGGIAGIIVAGGIGISGVVSGPLQVIHLSKLLSVGFFSRNENTNDTSVRRLYNTVAGQSEKNRLGPLASALTTRNLNRLSAMGIDTSFDTPDGKGRRKIQSISINPETPEGRNLLGKVQAGGVDLPAIQNGKITIDLRGTEGGRIAREMTDQMVRISGKSGISGWVSKRRLNKLFGVDFHPLSVLRRRGEDLNDYYRRRRAERAQETKDGVRTNDVDDPTGSTNEEGDVDPVDSDVSSEGGAAGDVVDDIQGTPDPIERRGKLKAIRSSALFRGGATAAAVVAVTCAVKDTGDRIPEYKMLNVIAPLIRLSIQYVAAGSQIQALQDIDLPEIGSLVQALYDEETNTAVTAAVPLKNVAGQTGGTEIDPAVKSQIVGAYSGDKPDLFEAIDSIPFVGAACAANSWFGNLPIIRNISNVTNDIVNGLASITTGKSVDDWMGDLVAVLSGDAIDVLAEGGQLGNLLAYGSNLAANSSAIAYGGVELTDEQVAAWEGYNYEVKLAQRQDQSWTERTFDIYSPDTLAGGLAYKVSGSANLRSVSNFIQTGPSSIFSSLFSGISSITTRRAGAAPIPYDYGVPEYGIPLSILNSTRYENVFDNIDRLEDNDFAKLKEGNAKWGKCFGNPLDDQGNIVDKEADGTTYASLEDCSSDYGNQEFQDYQMYILDNVTIKSMACYEGIDEQSCSEMGFRSATTTTPNTGVGSVAIVRGDTSNIPCAAGEDLGVHDGYVQGEIVRIRVCRVHGTSVNSQISGNINNLYTAASAARISLSGGGFRTMQEQEQIFSSHCPELPFTAENCEGAARPGYSNHQMGLAIDFSCNGDLIPRTYNSATSNSCFQWLSQNAAIYGLKEWGGGTAAARARGGYEGWHWSVDGR